MRQGGSAVRAWAVAVALVIALAAGLFVVLRPGPQVPASRVAPVALPYTAPSYAALGVDGLLIRSGPDLHVVGGRSARWLPGGPRGSVLLSRSDDGTQQVVVDAGTGAWGREVSTDRSPGAAVSQVDVRRGRTLDALDLTLAPRWSADLPADRTYADPPVTVGSGTFVSWSQGGGADGPRSGWRRIGVAGPQRDVLVGDDVVQLSPSADGAALLGLREPVPPTCRGCVAPQRVVEVDPDTGEVSADYGVPGSYDPSWRVTAIDKVGTRVAVRFESTSYVGQPGSLVPVLAQEGTWVYDDGWSLLPDSRTELTWWQGPTDRVVARVVDEAPTKDGLRLYWLHGTGAATVVTQLPGELATPGARQVHVGSVPGQLLPPA